MIQISKATKDDSAVIQHMLDEMGSFKDEGYLERCFQELELNRLDLLIARTDEKAGFVMLNWAPKYSLYKKLEIPEIQDLNVVPEQRRKGVASALIKHCEDLAVQKGCAHIGISVGLYSDYGPAQRLYAKLGYVPDGNGVSYDRQSVQGGELRPIDDELCLMMIKPLKI